ncbi:hypothetical protein TWF281_007130 [Arthrobotrys megalospora]
MATLAALPTEVFGQIASHLPRKSQLLLRQCSKPFERMSDNDMLFKTQRYYHSIIDCQALVAFATDPAHANARRRCKTLVIDSFSPDSMKIRCKVSSESTITVQLTTPRLENRRIIELLTTALDNLPSLECIEFSAVTNAQSIPIAIFQSHYPSLGLDLRDEQLAKEFRLGYRKAKAYEDPPEDETFRNTMEAVAQSFCQLKAIRFPELTDLSRWEWEGIYSMSRGNNPTTQWFCDEGRMERLQPRLQSLKKLELSIRARSDSDHHDVTRDFENARPGMRRFLETMPNVEELRLKVGHLSRLNVPPSRRRKPPRPFPTNPIDVGSLKFRNLRILSLMEQAFVESELSAFLTSHKDILRKVELTNCVLHSEYQIWSGIFKLLETDLSLWSFEFQTGYPRMDYYAMEQLRIVPWFRVYGNVRTQDHRCELFPKDEGHRTVNRQRISFEQAMQVVTRLEDKIILENDTGLNARNKDAANKMEILDQGRSPDYPEAQSPDYHIQLLMLELSNRQILTSFRGIQPKHIEAELIALGVQGFGS